MKDFLEQMRQMHDGTAEEPSEQEPELKTFVYNHCAPGSAVGIVVRVKAPTLADAVDQVQIMFDSLELTADPIEYERPDGTVIYGEIQFRPEEVGEEDFEEE